MNRRDLSKVESYLYHNDYNNPLRLEIGAVLERYGLHGLTEITEELNPKIVALDKQIKDKEVAEQKEHKRQAKLRKLRKKR